MVFSRNICLAGSKYVLYTERYISCEQYKQCVGKRTSVTDYEIETSECS
jgi:hypothetical protein